MTAREQIAALCVDRPDTITVSADLYERYSAELTPNIRIVPHDAPSPESNDYLFYKTTTVRRGARNARTF